MSGRLSIKPLPLVLNLIGEMREALEAMERGDYDKAFEILDQRCRSSAPMVKPPKAHTLPGRAAAAEIFKNAPAGVLLAHHEGYMMVVAESVGAVVSRPVDEVDADNLAVAFAMASDCGVALEWSA